MSVDTLVINLTRFGDLLQSQGLIDDLHKAGHRVGLVCLDHFATALPLLRGISDAWPLRGSALLSNLAQNWHKSLALITDFTENLALEAKPRNIINLTPTLPARLLTRMLAGPSTQTFGFGIDQYGYGFNHGVWASFFSVAASKRANSPFNLSDLMRMMALPLTGGMKGSFRLADPDTEALAWAHEYIKSASNNLSPKGYVAFQLGASEERRRWPVENFRELGRRLWQNGYLPILLGNSAEKPLAEKYGQQAGHPFIDAVGKTDIPKLAALLKQNELLVTNDTGTMHLAAGLDIPILAFFLATAQPWDTGPLRPGSLSLEPDSECHPCAFGNACDHNRCRKLLTPQIAADYATALLNGVALPVSTESGARIWQTCQKGGFTQISLVAPAQPSGPGKWLLWQREFWRQLLDNLENYKTEPIKDNLAEVYQGLKHFPEMAKFAPLLEQAANVMVSIGDCAPAASKMPKMGTLLLRHSERLQTMLDANPFLGSFAAFWREFRLTQGDDLNRFGIQCGIMGQHVKSFAATLKAA